MKRTRVLFVSTRNSCRSRMAAAYLNAISGGMFEAESAGYIPQEADRFAVDAMKEENIDMPFSPPRSLQEARESARLYNYVIFIGSRETSMDAPSFPGANTGIRWLIDGASYSGISTAQRFAITRKIRDEIRSKVIEFIQLHNK